MQRDELNNNQAAFQEKKLARSSIKRRPLIPVILAVSAGIILDEYLRLPFSIWFSCSGCLFCLWFLLSRYHDQVKSFYLLLVCIACLGAAHHHWNQFTILENDISCFTTDDWIYVRLKGVVRAPARIKTEKLNFYHGGRQFKQHKTIIELQTDSLKTNRGWIETSGITRVQIKGRINGLLPGDQVELTGWLTKINKPQNPGEFDFQTWVRRKSIRTLLFTEHPLAVRVQNKTNVFPLLRISNQCRNYCKNLLSKHLSPDNQSLAFALFLGDRSHISEETRESLAESGMFHLISISGLHVGFLALMLFIFCRLSGLDISQSALIIITLLSLYAFFTGARPPVLRATLVISCYFCGLIWNRNADTYNLLAFSILVLLIFNPAVLFDTGAQLSYLAVIGLVEGSGYFLRWKSQRSRDRLRELLRRRSPIHQVGHDIFLRFIQSSMMMAGIFFVCLPLIESKFHLISISGFLMNLILMPVAGVCICAGYLILLMLIIFPSIAEFPISFMDQFLTFFLKFISELTNDYPSYIYSPGYPNWWLVIFYVLLLLFILARNDRNYRIIKLLPILLLSWSCFGFSLIFLNHSNGELRGTFLSVGHGTSVLLEFPNGKTLLYDAGSLNHEKRVASIVESALWNHGHSRIDVVVISHADIDHCNAIPYLMEQVPIGSIITTPSFLDFQQSVVELVCTKSYRNGIPFELASANDQILIDQDVSVQLIHPSTIKQYDSDNQNSIVLLIEYQGRRILLPGDIEEEALDDLIKNCNGDFDIFMSPHHGSLKANDQKTIKWANPVFAITSGAGGKINRELKVRYGDKTKLLSTDRDGAISFVISPNGEVEITSGHK